MKLGKSGFVPRKRIGEVVSELKTIRYLPCTYMCVRASLSRGKREGRITPSC